MRNRDFVKYIRLKHKYLYIELKYKQDIIELKSRLIEQLKEIQELKLASDQTYIRPSILELENSIKWEIQGLISEIRDSNSRIRNQRRLCKIKIS